MTIEQAGLTPADGVHEPVFVLCNGRSGSTLLRFLLDAHPDLACPPETNVPAMAAQLATVWSLIEGAPLSAERGDAPPAIPDAAIAGVRRTLDEMTEPYLRRRGKLRYCDKSLGTARWAELLLRVFPHAQFLCLYRHPMDVVASGIEACPWGLTGYGFDQYIASTPGNAVWALARFWADNASVMLTVAEKFPASCYRVRYEDLVDEPEGSMDKIFGFLGVAPQPGISERCFSARPERFGPADYKIWHTSQVSSSSLGRGWSIPAALIPPPLRERMNELAATLGYHPVDDVWGTGALPRDLRTDREQRPSDSPDGIDAPEATSVEVRLRDGVTRIDGVFARRWGPCSGESFGVVMTPSTGMGNDTRRWRVDIAARTVSDATGADGDDTDWDIVGSADAWLAVLGGRTNLGVAMRRCYLRYCQNSEGGPVGADNRLDMLAELLTLNAATAALPGA
jgi:Sulfotransferase family